MSNLNKQSLVVSKIINESETVKTFKLSYPDLSPVPSVTAGAHLVCYLGNGLTRQYSLINGEQQTDAYYISVLKDADSRGGSAWMHENLKVGDSLLVSGPKNQFPLVIGAERSILIGGGIGITPLLSMAKTLFKQGSDFVLYYCARYQKDAAFVEHLKNCEFADKVQFYFSRDAGGRRMPITDIVKTILPGQHLYCCGPNLLMDAVANATLHWPRGSVHFEKFKANQKIYEDKPFVLELSRSQKTFQVPAEQNALEVLHENGYDIDMVCGEGICGACLVNVSAGEIEHRDEVLSDDEKAENDIMTLCCSRAKSNKIVIEL
ncbi:PDR/VanB family oxidoreductase [Gayadomonas joobiniege]|uniref:PDR/VanB family oxidoreductase n=1 Tax=Gayadomonas joobiniege TaxID=1234606 RepID=UPI00037AB8DD|nr:PDR/VanB family oxidoreductase [Gayadomonas joobiniege]